MTEAKLTPNQIIGMNLALWCKWIDSGSELDWHEWVEQKTSEHNNKKE